MKMIKEWHKLSNGYWLKIMFIFTNFKKWGFNEKVWLIDIAVGKTRRKINDHYNSTKKSPKCLNKKSTNHKGGIESLLITLKSMQKFEKTLNKGDTIIIESTDEQRSRVYSRLLRYGFTYASWNDPGMPWHKLVFYFKEF